MLKSKISEFSLSEGADMIGFASVDRFKGAPEGHHPEDFISSAKTVISIGMMVPKNVLNYENLLTNSQLIPQEIRKEYLQKYHYRACGYTIINDMLEQLAYKINRYLEKSGFNSMYFTTTYGNSYAHIQKKVPGEKGIFSHRHAAVRAGLGEFGLNNVVVTSEFGPRVRFNSIITDVFIEPDELLQEKVCLGLSCQKCIDECGTGAIKFTTDESQIDDTVFIDPVTTTEVHTCKPNREEAFCVGRCLRVCPVGE